MSDVEAVYRHPVRVYWEDTDAGGVVFYGNYLKFFERARTEWLRTLGIGQQRLRDETGTVFIVTETRLRYLAPARLDDLLDVTVAPQNHSRATMTLRQQAWRAPADAQTPALLLCDGDIRIACVDVATFRPRRIPDAVFALLTSPR